MSQGANVYARNAQATQSPRELEANLLMKAASRLQNVQDDWSVRAPELEEALTYNRKLWTILATSATEAENPLPREIKQNIANLALFIFNRTVDLMIKPRPEGLGVLVSINRQIAAGLRERPAQPSPEAT
ncbi:MAG: flagellar biosynthesis regulatory protein FlaF [Salinarimonadaceae bacterium]|nr:MAG: flagellar biosynthesis regulatory protein FlaF [Salinarimonadaceae bacterium]